MTRSALSLVAGIGLLAATPALGGLLGGLLGPAPGFEVFSVDNKGGGWVIHHMPGRGDSVWGCKDLATVTDCTQVYLEEWKTGAKLSFIHISDKSQKAWLKVNAPAMGDYLYACQDPEGTPACTKIELEMRPATSGIKRVWPTYECDFDCGTDKCCGDVLPESDPRRIIEAPDRADMLIQVGLGVPAPTNLYACKGLEGTPSCELTVPNWLVLDREDYGLSKLDNVEDDDKNVLPGAIIAKIDEDSVADEAGLDLGDVIVKVGAFDIRNAAHARYMLLQYPAEATVTITLDDGRTVDLKARRKPKKEK